MAHFGRFRLEVCVIFRSRWDLVAHPFNDTDADDDSGIAFDFKYDDIDELISLLRKLKLSEATKYDDDESDVDKPEG